jgi:hypothetical protein
LSRCDRRSSFFSGLWSSFWDVLASFGAFLSRLALS